MISIALYLFFISTLSGFRSSKYWPKALNAGAWLAHPLHRWGSLLFGISLSVLAQGWTTGMLFALCAYMAMLSAVIFFANSPYPIRFVAVLLFHLACLVGFLLQYKYAC